MFLASILDVDQYGELGYLLALVGTVGAFGLIAWFKSGGDSDWFFAIFFGLIILVVVVILAGVVAMFVRDYLDEKTKIKNSYAKFFITRLTWVGLIILVFFIYIKVF